VGSIWTIALHTTREALRMRVVLAFAILILAVVAGMPLAVYRPDALISAMVQTFLAWTLMPLGALLSLLAIFLGCLSISDDMVNRQIFLLACKPLPRWKYVVGKWLGAVIVLSGLLFFAAACIYGTARLLAARPGADPRDPMTLRHQVLTARASSHLYTPDLTARAEQIFQMLVEQGRLSDPSRPIGLKLEESAADEAKAAIRKELEAAYRTVNPGAFAAYEFRGIVLPPGVREVRDLELLGVPLEQREEVLKILSEEGGLAKPNDLGYFADLPKTVVRRVPREEAQRLGERLHRAGAEVAGHAGYYLQLRYKAQGLGYLPDESLETSWAFGPSPELAAQQRPIKRKDRKDHYHVINFPADAVGDDGRVFAVVRNDEDRRQDKPPEHPGAVVQFETGSLETLYVIGTFEGNLARTLLLVWCRVVLIAGVAVFTATFLSFPVACLVTFLFYVLAISGDYVTSAMKFGAPGEGTLGPASLVVQPVLETLFWALPKFARYDGVENFVDGRNVSLMWDLQALGNLVLLLTAAFLLGACIIFQRRQVAELSV
jgi:ABC-type transport system involved in multi-copper enzyme maturation permease subunit